MYADEERCFLLLVDVLRVTGTGEDVDIKALLKASCAYRLPGIW
jgi:hypothetical protein